MNEKLKSVLRVLKDRSLVTSTNNTELARLSGLSRQTINRNSEEIEAYLLTATEPSDFDNQAFDRKIIQTYLDEGLSQAHQNGEKYAFASILGAVTGFVLRQETDLINNVQQTRKVVKVGTAVIKLIIQIQARKDNTGTPIHSKSKHAQYLLSEMNQVGFMDHLFRRKSSYQTGAYAKEWRLTNKAEEVINRVIELSLPIIKEEVQARKVTVIPAHVQSSMCSGISVTSGKTSLLPPELTTFDIEIDQLQQLSVPSIIQLINKAMPSPIDNHLSISLENTSNTDPNLGRTYNVFTSLRSTERRDLGFINYDISGGLQIIAFGILYHNPTDPDLFDRYPMLFRYGWEPDYKRELRQQIADDLGKTIDEVKALLTAYANGSQRSVEGSSALEQFQQESDQLRREVTSVIAQNRPEILEAAIRQSKHEFPEDLDWRSTEPEEPELARKKSSVFFFIWTHYEKQIRDAMLSVVDDGIPLHDAIYSRHDLPCEDFEQAVKDQTGFEVKITH
jgi:DNA-binding transcriptional MerR regulator